MLMTENQAATASVIAAAVQTPASTTSDGQVANELVCQYPSKKCRRVRATKRGGDLHRLCEFHRERANKNQWLVDQRRRLRRECQLQRNHSGALAPAISAGPPIAVLSAPVEKPRLQPALVLTACDSTFETNSPMRLPLRDDALNYLEALLFDDDDDILYSDCTDDGYMTDVTVEWTL